jgi:hypothetical protein
VTNFLNVSTLHLTPSARAWLNETATENHAANYHGAGRGGRISTLGATLTGWFTWVPQPDVCEHLSAPVDLLPVFNEARKAECNYILFDRDADAIPGLPRYDEDGVLFEQDDAGFVDAGPQSRQFAVDVVETISYTVEVDAFDEDHAGQLARDMWAASSDPMHDFSGNSRGVEVEDVEEMGEVVS